jgi:hypothetical protein
LLLMACSETVALPPPADVTPRQRDLELAVDAAPDEDAAPAAGELPTEMADLYGVWVHDDGELVRALEFAPVGQFEQDLQGKSPVYYVYVYPSGGNPKQVQRGEAKLQFGPKVTLTPVWSKPPGAEPSQLTFLPAPKGSIVLQSPAGTQLSYDRADFLP